MNNKIVTPTFEKEINKVLPFFEQKTFPKNRIIIIIIIEEKSTVDSFYFLNRGILQCILRMSLERKTQSILQ